MHEMSQVSATQLQACELKVPPACLPISAEVQASELLVFDHGLGTQPSTTRRAPTSLTTGRPVQYVSCLHDAYLKCCQKRCALFCGSCVHSTASVVFSSGQRTGTQTRTHTLALVEYALHSKAAPIQLGKVAYAIARLRSSAGGDADSSCSTVSKSGT